jgi:hypothetical protein
MRTDGRRRVEAVAGFLKDYAAFLKARRLWLLLPFGLFFFLLGALFLLKGEDVPMFFTYVLY